MPTRLRRFSSWATAMGVMLALAAFPSCGARTGLGADDLLGGESSSTSDGAAGARLDGAFANDGDTDAMVGCTPGIFVLTRAVPAVMFVVDRSRSMDEAFSGGTKWSVLTGALANTLPPIDQDIETGALIFPVAGGGMSMTCDVPGEPDLTPALGNASAFVQLMQANGPNGATPTAPAIDAAALALQGTRASATARAMVLATDGEPDCNADLDGNTCTCLTGNCRNSPQRCLDDTRTTTAIAKHAAEGIPTYVIGIANTASTEFIAVLDEMAKAGGRPSSGAHAYYAASSDAELTSALVTIRDQVGACTFLSSSVPSMDGSIVVMLGGQVIPFDPSGTNGWHWTNQANGELELDGAACDDAVGDAGSFTVTVECGFPDASTLDASSSTDGSSDTDASFDASAE